MLKIPNNWMMELLQKHDIHLRVFSCRPFEFQCEEPAKSPDENLPARPYAANPWNSLVKISSNKNLAPVLESLSRRREILKTSFSSVSGRAATGILSTRRGSSSGSWR